MANDWKDRLGMVYSTDPNYKFEYDMEEEEITLPPEKQHLIVTLDRKQRKGKAVTLIKGFIGSTDDLKELGKYLKNKCGVGGTAKEGIILVQGDFRPKIQELLKGKGYKVKQSGG